MAEKVHFSLHSTYDDKAYRVLAKSTWILFQKHRLQVMAYPALFSIAVLIGCLLIYNWNSCSVPLRVGGIAFTILQFAVIPISAKSAQRKTFRKAVRDAKSKGSYPSHVEFTFSERAIHAAVGQDTAVVTYRDVTRLCALRDWRLLFFPQGSYIIPTAAFSGPDELDRFDTFVSKKCGLPFDVLEGEIPGTSSSGQSHG